MTTLEESIANIAASAEQCTDETRSTVGKKGIYFRQGDLTFWHVPLDWARGKKTNDMKLAKGTSKGSTHVMQAGVCEVYEGAKVPAGWYDEIMEYYDSRIIDALAKEALGPLVIMTADGEVTHPEHANTVMAKDTAWQVTYQIDAVTKSRVED